MDAPVVDVAIVGAGMAGLAAAQRATEHGLSHVVLEATDRIGGRIRSVDLGEGLWWEAGCATLSRPAVNPLVRLADRHGIGYQTTWASEVPILARGELLDSRASLAVRELIDDADSLLHDLAESGGDVPYADLLDPDAPQVGLARHLLHLELGADPSRVSALDRFGEGVMEGDWPLYRPFADFLTAMFPDVTCTLNSPVRVIDWGSDPLRLDLGHDLVEARTALVTCSTGVLASGQLVFAPDLDEMHRTAIEALPMGSLVRGVAVPEFELTIDPNAAVQFVDDIGAGAFELRPSGLNLITYTLAAPYPGSPPPTEQALFSLLAQVTGNTEYRQIDLVDWAADEWTRGCWSMAAPGRTDARGSLAQPLGGRVWFAGEATSQRSHGTAYGAMRSGEDVLDRIATHLGVLPQLPQVSDTDDIFRFDF